MNTVSLRTCVFGIGVACALVASCRPGLSRQERERVMAWLTCEECVDGELAYLSDTLGWRARGPLREALVAFPQAYRDRAVVALRAAWLDRPDAIRVDSITYRNEFLSNYEARLQRRAILGLAALGDTATLREAWDAQQGGLVGYRGDVASMLERSLGNAGTVGFAPQTVGTVTLIPDALSVPAGGTGSLEARVSDPNGDPVSTPLTWRSTDEAVATVTSPSWGHGRVEARSPGAVYVSATAGAAIDSALVTVTPAPPPPPDLTIREGDGQRVPVGTQVPQALVVRVVPSGGPASGLTVEWRFLRNGPPGLSTSTTDANGDASFRPTLGPNPGRVWIAASVPGQTIRFQLVAFVP